jgi:hypothetical protein
MITGGGMNDTIIGGSGDRRRIGTQSDHRRERRHANPMKSGMAASAGFG